MTIYVPRPPLPIAPTQIELSVQRALTDAYIATRPYVIEMVPQVEVETPAGGKKIVATAARPPQTVRLIESGSPNVTMRNDNGEERRTTFEIIGSWNAVFAQGDTFTIPGQQGTWYVHDLYSFNGYEQRAEVIRRG